MAMIVILYLSFSLFVLFLFDLGQATTRRCLALSKFAVADNPMAYYLLTTVTLLNLGYCL